MTEKHKSIKEMKKMFHNPTYSKIVVYGYKHFSVYVTKFLLMLPFTANFWTFMIFAFTTASAVVLGFGDYKSQIIGMALLHIAFMLDVCDGEVALYRNKFSIRGKFLDYLSHGAFPVIYLALGLGIHLKTSSIQFLYMGITAMFFHSFCAHNRWAFLSTIERSGTELSDIRKKDSFARKVVRLATMGNFEFETGTFIFIMILLKLDWIVLSLFAVWLPLKWAMQIIMFYTDLIPKKGGRKIKQSF